MMRRMKKKPHHNEEEVLSDWDADIDSGQHYRARPPYLQATKPSQQRKVILFQCRKHPEGWPKGVRPKAPPKPDRLNRKVSIQEECEYLEPVNSYVYEEPEIQKTAHGESYEPVGGMEDPE